VHARGQQLEDLVSMGEDLPQGVEGLALHHLVQVHLNLNKRHEPPDGVETAQENLRLVPFDIDLDKIDGTDARTPPILPAQEGPVIQSCDVDNGDVDVLLTDIVDVVDARGQAGVFRIVRAKIEACSCRYGHRPQC
jgi:hypothetical protein